MGIFIGKEGLVERRAKAGRIEDKKGITGEIEIGELLKRYLPKDTYIIAQPDIGELQPDFLVISPSYGFRLVEIKNMGISYINEVLTNGGLVTDRYGTKNPWNQVRNQADQFHSFLVSNFPYFQNKDPYRGIGYCVIHRGITKAEFEYKFSKTLSAWSDKERHNYYKHHFFSSELGYNTNALIQNATKFQSSYLIDGNLITQIVTSISSSYSKKFESDPFEELNNQKVDINNLNRKVMGLYEEVEQYKTSKKKGKNKKGFIALTVCALIAIIIVLFIFIGREDSRAVNTSGYGIETINPDEYVVIEGEVKRFYYDPNSKTKFLTISVNDNEMDAVIFKDIKVPFIKEGETLVFSGYTQLNPKGDQVELRITGIK